MLNNRTHDDDGAGEGDGGHAAVGDGVSAVGKADGLIIAVDASLVRAEHQRQDGWGQSRCKKERWRQCEFKVGDHRDIRRV